MKNCCFSVVGLLLAGLVAGCQDSIVEEAVAAPTVAAGCSGCHQGKRSFSGRDAQKLADAIRAIRDGELRHPPLGLPDPGDEAIDALAKELTET